MSEWSEAEKRQAQIVGAAMEAAAEAKRALDKHGPKNTMDAPDKTDGDRLAILVEEVGEVAKELTYDHAGIQIESTGERPDPFWVRQVDVVTVDGITTISVHDPDGQNDYLLDEMDDEQLRIIGYRRSTRQDRIRKELIQAAAMALTWAAMLP